MAIDLNLEIIVDENHSLLAYHHDLPDDLMPMVINAGQWQIFDEENLIPEILWEVREKIITIQLNLH